MKKSKRASSRKLKLETETVLPDAFTQIQRSKDEIVAAVIRKAIDDGSYQHAKWLFEFGGIVPAGHSSPQDDPSLARLFLDHLQITESGPPPAELSANDHAVE